VGNHIEPKKDNSKEVIPKMDRTNRAKQFIAFDPLKGYQEALREKELSKEQERESEP
jgi:hypothetical protein